MRSTLHLYPLDRYLVEHNKKIEMVNIIGDEIWNPEPALKPEDEIILKKLHDMLQSTADDLKLLSGELSKYHEPGVQVKTQPTPLDDEFNEKVHIEEVVNAKFHGYKIVDKSSLRPSKPTRENKTNALNHKNSLLDTKINTGIQTNKIQKNKNIMRRNLGISRTNIMQINEIKKDSVVPDNKTKVTKQNNKVPTVSYNEISYKYVEPNIKTGPASALKIQDMPSINIRSELKPQKVLQIDIIPNIDDANEKADVKNNVAVIAIQHNTEIVQKEVPSIDIKKFGRLETHFVSAGNKQPIRKVFKMSSYESSESTNNANTDRRRKMSSTQKPRKTILRVSPKRSASDRDKDKNINKTEKTVGEWKQKLSSMYGPLKTRKKNIPKPKPTRQLTETVLTKTPVNTLNNAEYIPYSQLTLGGVSVSDIENEISDIPNRNDILLSPVLDRILSSRENSFNTGSPNKSGKQKNQNILTTSDENLLQEVLDIEKKVSLLTNRDEKVDKSQDASSLSNAEDPENEIYVDDFEEDKSENFFKEGDKIDDENNFKSNSNNKEDNVNQAGFKNNLKNMTYTKSPTLSFKNPIDIHEYIHSVETQETATQSNTHRRISPKETQTSPRNDKSNLQPIHNDLWPTVDPLQEIEKMFKLEKDFIKKLIIDEYGDLLEKNINKPSTSTAINESEDHAMNIAAFQKNTQTSPARVKSITTSPPRTKTRTTSPFMFSLRVDRQTSPLATENYKFEIENEAADLGISINLSSPRFSLRLPQTSREVISNLDACSQTSAPKGECIETKEFENIRTPVNSSSSVEAEESSDISSLGEVKLRLKQKFKNRRTPSYSESSSSSTMSRWCSDLDPGGILPLKSEGEIGLVDRARNMKIAGKSDGEVSNAQS